ncbi:ribosome maturation protein RimP [Parasphingopyxis marina]|uniref:Ribosome maturation factor RimP n=1 Tax=Parasphingopyxis marina TaxID=2761622 RepID=A0A842HYB7_9SPHN|nr:ribosome maturation protein RimP [Parasphingopyxis marina]MBC2779198.1 ribosome maturation protein RimP [Parasphingopyxis marina]
MADIAALTQLIEPEVEALGFALVRVKMTSGEDGPILQVMAEREDTRQLVIEDCAEISRALSKMLDETDPIDGAYRLEVSSPGIDRPLTRLKDFDDWAGHDARINLIEPVLGKKHFKCVLKGREGEAIHATIADKPGAKKIDAEENDHIFDFKNIHSAKLVLTDRLIRETAPLSTEGAETITEEG